MDSPQDQDEWGYWDFFLQDVLNSPEMLKLKSWLEQRVSKADICPEPGEIFRAYKETPYEEVKVVILDQEPYSSRKYSDGLAFSSKHYYKIPRSLLNIKKELHRSLELEPTQSGDLSNWAKQGVFLLNLVLTVEEGKPGSHKNKGWEHLTDLTLQALNNHPETLVFLLFGNVAQEKRKMLDPRHIFIQCGHPSPAERGKPFIGSDCFLKVNYILRTLNKTEIDWSI